MKNRFKHEKCCIKVEMKQKMTQFRRIHKRYDSERKLVECQKAKFQMIKKLPVSKGAALSKLNLVIELGNKPMQHSRPIPGICESRDDSIMV